MSKSIDELFQQLEDRDIRIRAVDDRLLVDAPTGALTPDLRRALEENKPQILSALKVDWAADARKVIDALPDQSLRPVLIDYFHETASAIQQKRGVTRDEAEKQAFGLLLFQILRCGIDARSPTQGSEA